MIRYDILFCDHPMVPANANSALSRSDLVTFAGCSFVPCATPPCFYLFTWAKIPRPSTPTHKWRKCEHASYLVFMLLALLLHCDETSAEPVAIIIFKSNQRQQLKQRKQKPPTVWRWYRRRSPFTIVLPSSWVPCPHGSKGPCRIVPWMPTMPT